MLLLGGRYGSIEPNSGKSYTHLEYDYAVEKGKPLFALVITDDASEARVREHGSSVIERTNPSQYIEFKKLVLSNMSAFWEDKKDIKIKTGESLNNISRRDGLIGWVRSDKTINPEVTNEIARLSKENSELRKNAGGATFNGLTFEEMKTLLEKENTLEALVKNRLGLLSEKMSQNRLSDSAIRKLLERDLIARAQDHNRNDILRLTDVGRMFLNKLDIEN